MLPAGHTSARGDPKKKDLAVGLWFLGVLRASLSRPKPNRLQPQASMEGHLNVLTRRYAGLTSTLLIVPKSLHAKLDAAVVFKVVQALQAPGTAPLFWDLCERALSSANYLTDAPSTTEDIL